MNKIIMITLKKLKQAILIVKKLKMIQELPIFL